MVDVATLENRLHASPAKVLERHEVRPDGKSVPNELGKMHDMHGKDVAECNQTLQAATWLGVQEPPQKWPCVVRIGGAAHIRQPVEADCRRRSVGKTIDRIVDHAPDLETVSFVRNEEFVTVDEQRPFVLPQFRNEMEGVPVGLDLSAVVEAVVV